MTLLSLCAAAFTQAKVILSSFSTGSMVIQQNSQLTLPGKAKAGRQVTVKVSQNHEKYAARALAGGHFSIEVPTSPVRGPYQIIASDGEKLMLNNILSGEVWICSGQLNMKAPIAGRGKMMNYEQEVADVDYPSIRLLRVKKTVAFSSRDDVEINMNDRQECSPTTVPGSSSIAYFYVRKLWRELNVPVGVIDCTWGGTPAESWTNHQTLKQATEFQKKMAEMENVGFRREKLVEPCHREMDEWLQQFNAKDAGFKDGVPQWVLALQTRNEWKPMELPAYWETRKPNFNSTIWFQKETEVPVSWDGKGISSHLAVIDDNDATHFNGKEIGRTSGCSMTRAYRIPAALAKVGREVVTIRAISYGGEDGTHRESQQMYIEANGRKISLTGNRNYRTRASMTGAPPRPLSPERTGWPTSYYPTVLYNVMIYPFTVFPTRGTIWCQGENNVGFGEQYRVFFQSVIADWRRVWGRDFSFYFVQLANYLKPEEAQPGSRWTALRDAQAHAPRLSNTGMAYAIDLGGAYNIRPKNKQEVEKQPVQVVLTKAYNRDTYEVPAFLGYHISGRMLIPTFDQEVVAKEGAPKGFILAGPGEKYVPAQATIRGKEVTLQSDRIEIPTMACYAWTDNPVCNLYGKSGLPIPPFRTRE